MSRDPHPQPSWSLTQSPIPKSTRVKDWLRNLLCTTEEFHQRQLWFPAFYAQWNSLFKGYCVGSMPRNLKEWRHHLKNLSEETERSYQQKCIYISVYMYDCMYLWISVYRYIYIYIGHVCPYMYIHIKNCACVEKVIRKIVKGNVNLYKVLFWI